MDLKVSTKVVYIMESVLYHVSTCFLSKCWMRGYNVYNSVITQCPKMSKLSNATKIIVNLMKGWTVKQKTSFVLKSFIQTVIKVEVELIEILHRPC